MKSLKAFLVGPLMAFFFLCIGGNTLSMATEQKTVTLYHIWGAGLEKKQMTKSIAQFEEANPDVEVEVILGASGQRAKLIQMLSTDNPPDVFLWYPGARGHALADKGVIAPITELWDNYGLDYFFPAGIKDEVTYKGEQWNLPWGYHPNIVVYSKRIFDALGLSTPNTLEEFEDVCDTVKSAGYCPISSAWKGLWRADVVLELLIPSFGGPDFYQDLVGELEVDWGHETCRKAYTVWKRWVEKGYWFPDPRSRRWIEGLRPLVSEECAMFIIGTYGVPLLKDAGWVLGEDFNVFLFPQENRDYPRTLMSVFDTWCMSANAPHPVEAHRLLAFLATTGPQTMRAIYHGGMACNRFVTAYDSVGRLIQDAIDNGAVFRQLIFSAMPPPAAQLIGQGTIPDFYDNPDIEEFIERCETTREEYWEEKRK